jgi:hypothetical protein
MALRMPSTQTWLTKQIASYLSRELSTRVEVKGVDIEFFKKIVLEGFYVEDQHKDTLVYISRLKVDIRKFDLEKHYFLFGLISLQNAKVYLKTYKNENKLNLDFIIEAFSSSDTSSAPGPQWHLEKTTLEIENTYFRLDDENEPAIPYGMDYAHLDVRSLNALFSGINLYRDTLTFQTEYLSLLEKSGFSLRMFKSDSVRMTPGEMSLKNLIIKTPDTELKTDIKFSFERWGDFTDFNTKVMMNSSLRNAKVSMADIAYFAPDLRGMDNELYLSADVKGTVSKFKARNLHIRMGELTALSGNLSMTGLPDIEETFIELKLDSLRTNQRDIETIPVPPFHEKRSIKLPEQFSKLGVIRLKGKYNGFMDDFVAYGSARTALGDVSSDINLKYSKKGKVTYSGHIASESFHLGRLLDQEHMLGQISLNANIEGSGFSKKEANARVEGNIPVLELNKYTYRNLQVNGNIAEGLFSGKLKVSDPNINLDFDGSVNLNPSLPVFSFTARIDKARLKKLHFIDRDSSSMLSASVTARFSGNNPDNLEGTLSTSDLEYSEKGKLLFSKKTELSSVIINNQKIISLSSDMIQGLIQGNFRLGKLPASFQKVLSSHIANIPAPPAKNLQDQDFEFSFIFKNTEAVSALFFPSFRVSSGTRLEGSFRSQSNDFRISLLSGHLKTGNFSFRNVSLNGNTDRDRISLISSVSEILLNDSSWLKRSSVTFNSSKAGGDFSIAAAHDDSTLFNARIAGKADILQGGKYLIRLLPSDIIMDGNKWFVNENNFIELDSALLRINELNIYNREQKIGLNGNYVLRQIPGKETGEQLDITLTEFNIANFNQFLKAAQVKLTGKVNGKAFLYSKYNSSKPGLSSNLQINGFTFSGDSLGTVSLITTWDGATEIVNILAYIVKGNIRILELKGNYDLARKKNNIDFDLELRRVNLKLVSRYLKDYLSDVRGEVFANLKVKGEPDRPLLSGKLKLQRTGFVVNYLGTLYGISDEFTIAESYIGFDKVTLNDRKGNTAVISGKINHTNYSDFRFDLDVNTENFQLLSTTAAQNNLYYGTAYTTGYASVTGNVDDISINAAMRSEKGTQINIPLSNPEEVGESNFVKFVNKKNPAASGGKVKSDQSTASRLSGIQLNFDLEITPDADFQLIFDSKIGDIIKGQGSGNIKMQISTLGEFKMYGEYVIESGDYLFTLQNLINKRFRIEKGGTIQWHGNPTEAEINLNAVYKLKAKPDDLGLKDEKYTVSRAVDCKLNLSNKLLNPTINFGLDFPDLDDLSKSEIMSRIHAIGSLNDQFVSLLVFNRFKTNDPNVAPSNNNLVSTTGTELLSNQISNWASQLTNQFGFDVGFNYKPLNSYNQRELDIVYSTQIFKERLTLSGNVGKYTSQNTSNIVGDFNLEYKVSQDGKLRFKAFNRLNNNVIINNGQLYTQGLGVFYRKEFSSFRELLEEYRRKK